MTYDDMPSPDEPWSDEPWSDEPWTDLDAYDPGGLLRCDTTAATAHLTVRTPTDALALAPLVLGFHPADSVVLLTFGGSGFHARVDLPRDDVGRCEVVDLLVRALHANPCRQVMVLLYTVDEGPARAIADLLVAAVTSELGVEVVDVVRADGAHWWPLRGRRATLGVPYDVSSHPFTADAVLRGIVVRSDRDEVAGLLDGRDVGFAADVERALAALPATPLPPVGPARRRLAAWLRDIVQEWIERADLGSAEDVARALDLVREPDLRDVVWGAADRKDADEHLVTWMQVLRAAPVGWEASPAAVVAMFAWLCGDGALAWTAVEKSLEADSENSLANLVAEALDRAVPPSSWQPWGVDELLARHG